MKLDVDLTPPPPSSELTALVAHARPVRLRSPMRDALWFGAGLAVWAIVLSTVIGLRGDHGALPTMRWMLGGVAWVLVVILGLAAALRPAPGQVLPSVTAARVGVLVLPLVAAIAAVAFLVDAPGLTRHPAADAELGRIAHCLSIGVAIAMVPLLAALWAARGRLLVGRAWLGAAIGVGTGALGALVLHVVCPIGGVLHVLGGHAGVLVAGALLAALATRVVR